ncbi:MAG: hypothetical protein RL272_1276 [Candidatus Parcubacteria bacterium]|jgi:hypothetical protein
MQYLLMFVGVVIAALFISLARGTTRCELCGAPRDPKSKVPGTRQHGVRACDDCGRELDAMYDGDPPDPPLLP